MYCEQCGKPLSAGAKFCPECGVRVLPSSTLTYAATAADRIPPDDPVFVRRPTFIGWATLVSVLPIQLFMTFWAGGFCGGFSMLGVQAISAWTGAAPPRGATFIFWGAVAFFGIPISAYVSRRRSYAKAEYRFYRDRLEYYEGFLTVEQKIIAYRNVTEVQLRKGPVQRQYGLGTIVLSTPSTAISAQVARNGWFGGNGWLGGGIRVADIDNPDEIYEEVKRMVQEAQQR